MRRSLSIVLAIALPLAALAYSAAAAADTAEEELDVREATFRYQFARNASGLQGRAAAYCLSIRAPDGKDSDPPDRLLDRFVGNNPPVRKLSDCIASSDKGVVDAKTGGSGIIFNTGAIKWVSPTEVEIAGGYYEGILSASGNTYYLEKDDGKWKVLKDVLHWIS